ncbi:hypothetical protein [Allochromatium palmeri]|uniref:Cytochrome P450 n=1 Tax=Allochromatium palmeri TaxID=231048 RepID=A0A6N8EGQ4_9GAMM|nr:hypothetical protein [Allochromatium palmeri]MTW22258.1 hypothetical protein [Allochromatium palmeri]
MTLLIELFIARRVEPTTHMMRLDVDLTQEAPNGVGGNRRHDPAFNGFGGQLRVCPAHQFALTATRRLALKLLDKSLAHLAGEEQRIAPSRHIITRDATTMD